MGVDWDTCGECGTTFPDCGDYAYCETCGEELCPQCMNKHGVSFQMYDLKSLSDQEREEVYEEHDIEDGDEPSNLQCPFCAKEVVTDEALLEFALSEMGISRDELSKRLKESPKSSHLQEGAGN